MPPCRHISASSGACSKKVQSLIGTTIPIKYAVLDGAFGNNNAAQMILRCDMHIISKLKRTSALYFLFTCPYRGRGAKRKYGDKLGLQQYPTRVFERNCPRRVDSKRDLSNDHAEQVICPEVECGHNRKNQSQNRRQSSCNLIQHRHGSDYAKLIDYYKLRFQIEFNFRDAKQYWGLEDFMNVNEIPVILKSRVVSSHKLSPSFSSKLTKKLSAE